MIMIITPDEVFRSAMLLHFQEKDYELSIPEHRHDVTPLVEKHSPEVIVLDMSIADPNGSTILKDLREKGYAGKIIVISGPSNRPLMVDIHQQKVVSSREEISNRSYCPSDGSTGKHYPCDVP